MSNGFKGKYTRIKGLSDVRRFPRLGKIRLGLKRKAASGMEYPSETDYFVVPQEIEDKYGPRPKLLKVMFPVNDLETVFPQAYKFYGASTGIKCIGDGEAASRAVEKNGEVIMETVDCPSPENCAYSQTKNKKGEMHNGCARRGHLMVMLPDVNPGGVYQIDIGSANSIIDLNSGIEYISEIMRGMTGIPRFALIMLELTREPKEIKSEDGKKRTHYTLHIRLPKTADLGQLAGGTPQALLTAGRNIIEKPKDENPELDPVDVVDEEKNQPISGEDDEKPCQEADDTAVPAGPVTASTAQEARIEIFKLQPRLKLSPENMQDIIVKLFGKKASLVNLPLIQANILLRKMRETLEGNYRLDLNSPIVFVEITDNIPF